MFFDRPEKNWELTIRPTRHGYRIFTNANNMRAAYFAENVAAAIESLLGGREPAE